VPRAAEGPGGDREPPHQLLRFLTDGSGTQPFLPFPRPCRPSAAAVTRHASRSVRGRVNGRSKLKKAVTQTETHVRSAEERREQQEETTTPRTRKTNQIEES
jgi:hypothetical protein